MTGWYVLDHENNLVGPMSEYDARMVAFLVASWDGAYNVLTAKPEIYDAEIPVQDWVATHCEPNECNG